MTDLQHLSRRSAYQAYFGCLRTRTANWPISGTFTVGSVRVIVLQNDDNCLQDGGDYYVRGYSGGRQLRWLERELRRTRSSRDVDWVVVAMHQVMITSADFNGADLGLREAYGPLFDKYGVDLVVCGHEHDYGSAKFITAVSATPGPNGKRTPTYVKEQAA